MRRKTDREMTIHEARKVARTALRLKYSILAEREMNEVLPDIVETIDGAYAAGREFRLNPSDFFELEAG
jgi:hypothetical protein